MIRSATPSLLPATATAYHERARRVTEEVLADDAFAGLREREQTWWRDTLEMIGDAFFGVLAFINALPTWLWWIVVIWMVLTVVAICAHLLWMLVQAMGGLGFGRGRPGVAANAHGHVGSLYGIDDLDSDAVATRADQLIAAGDWPAAARHLYVAALLWLDRVGRVNFHQSKTDRDYLRELAGDATLSRRFGTLAGLFEAVAYGGRLADRAVCEQMRQNVQGIRDEVASTATR